MDRRRFITALVGSGLALGSYLMLRRGEGSRGPEHARSRTELPKDIDLMTTPVYDNEYNSYEHVDEEIAQALYPLTLQDAVSRGVIRREGRMRDYTLPLGIADGEGGIDFVDGMRDMWNAKRGISRSSALQRRRDHFVSLVGRGRTKSSLLAYRAGEIQHGADVSRELHENRRESYRGDYREFMDNVIGAVAPNALIGYNIQELVPPGFDGKQINPAFKTWFVDRLLKEAGKEFIEGYPARYDPYMSHGPFQMTNIPMAEVVGMNKYAGENDRVPRYVQNFEGLQHHVNAAVMLAHVRWGQMANHLRRHNLLRKFLRSYGRLDERERQIVVAGLTACMHHLPYPTMERTGYYVDQGDPNKMHYGIRRDSLTPQLRKYYDSAAESYLFMKVFDKLVGNYGTN